MTVFSCMFAVGLGVIASQLPAGATTGAAKSHVYDDTEHAYDGSGHAAGLVASGSAAAAGSATVGARPATEPAGSSPPPASELVAPSGLVDDFVQSAASSRTLGDNLVASGVTRPGNSAAHHIVAGNAAGAAEARATLARFGVDINSVDNGVFLPLNTNVANPAGAAVHSTLQTNAYYAGVNDLLGQATTRTEAVQALDAIRSQLLSGGFP